MAAETLAERDGVKVSRETLHNWMVEDGLWLSRERGGCFIDRGFGGNAMAN
ncbi:MAG: hypothetical protein H7245_10690 [Candidatus Saccharibacteria bacterium]|nr:hypothetical protein [Pseudorhodobacter sp.]